MNLIDLREATTSLDAFTNGILAACQSIEFVMNVKDNEDAKKVAERMVAKLKTLTQNGTILSVLTVEEVNKQMARLFETSKEQLTDYFASISRLRKATDKATGVLNAYHQATHVRIRDPNATAEALEKFRRTVYGPDYKSVA